ncbi:uncoupling protein [Chloropicon primus]|uniref:Uncoupling protein n=1 Tax=Chloropicon primus TaxID=1764295 RepID=A0A5B8MMR7_9CHLO|nr:uncoupling protein [Chloropicon primus]UPR00909.1 uncoupling protein [Chloropicon primus]|mmetsp:Transcript_14337/g.40773  ORF Transcript_14337/g.40773 Transcript_14337/m.40773 type:complete len:311 (+) Transcript_14337:74-1006(+)|eukprot:QDZ21687.1 uncoupling protein [Chloropicon primus]
MGGDSSNTQKVLPIWKTFPASAFSACTAELLTLPFDTAKVRLQLQGTPMPGVKPKYTGLIGAVGTIAKEEGAAALWKGWQPGLHRQCLFGGLRIGLYDPVKSQVSRLVDGEGAKDSSFASKVVSGLITGGVAISIANPTDLVKVRLQAQGRQALSSEAGKAAPKPKYPNAMAAYRMIAKEEGIMGLWTGVVPNITRNSVINATELATYDQVKQMLLASKVVEDGVPCHILSGLGAGLCACIVGSPVDVVKSRVMGDSAGLYSGTVDCFVKTLKNDGVMAFYKGFIPNFARLGSWNVAMFLTLEQVKRLIS